MVRIGKIVITVMLILALCMVPMGCGGESDVSDVHSFTLGSSVAFDTLNLLSSYMQVTYEFFLLVYDPLVRYDKNYDPIPCLAKDWEISDDELTWTFHLQEGVKWHDGEAFTSEDVKYTYELMMDTGLGYMYELYLSGITDIQCPDDNTVVITTDAPKANMLMNTTPILPKHILRAIAEEELETWQNENPVGTGPYKFDSQGDNFVKVVKNESYFGTMPNVDEFIFVDYENLDALAQALMLGEIDGATNMNPAQIKQLQADENIDVISGEELGFMQVGINCWTDSASKGNPLLLDKNIRHAIELAMNKQKIVDMAYDGQGAIGTTLLNPGDFFHYEPTAEELRSYDPEAANALLDASGYLDKNGDGVRETADGTPLEFDLITIADNVEEVKSGQMIVSDCAKAGIKLNNVTMDSGALYDKIIEGSYDMFIWGWGSDVDPTAILDILTTNQIGGNNEPFFSNARYDQLHTEQQNEMDESKRLEMVQEMQRIVYDEAPYIILIYSNNIQAIRSDRWTGYKQIPETGTYFFNLTNINYMNIKAVE
ncbi:MAG: ABC transporter substrate-binding protein [Eubacteriales bacterium]|nr:ABC transporter substrate-binding protein [Eubacteriales bacterium]MDD4583179.1 ABC transporter substrate-binding protein [Eubacteriales bacterium]